MRKLEQIESEADFIHESSNTNFSPAERKLAALISDLANHLADMQTTIDDVVSLQLDAAGIDMKPAYERMRKMIAERNV